MESVQTYPYRFLEGAGEMGALTRAFDWSKTQVGPIETWPVSLKTMVGTVLHSDFPMFLWWGDEMVQFYNNAYRPSLGNDGKHPKALGQRGVECWPEIWSIIFPRIERVRNTGESFFSEDELIPIYRNGRLEEVYWTFSYSAVIGETGSIDGVLVVCNETTNKVRSFNEINATKKLLAKSEENLRNIILQAPVAMCILKGADHTVEIVNERMLHLWGKQKQDILHKPIFEGLPEAKNQGFEERLNQVYTTGETFSANGVPVTLPRPGGIEIVYINFVYEAYREMGGKITGIMAIASEVTDQIQARKKVQELVTERTKELAVSNQNLIRSNSELSQFAYVVSHDLQEPARKISSFADMLARHFGASADARSKDLVERIDKSAARMLELINGILKLSQLSRDGMEFTKVRIADVIETAKKDFELLIAEKDCVIELGDLPVIEAIPMQMNQLFDNLLSNALKFSRPGVNPCVTISSRILPPEDADRYAVIDSQRDYVEISVADNGIGFSQGHADQIFEVFQRLHNTEYKGTGIGLAICKKIVENHHGTIYAKSKEGAGATFYVILPLVQVPENPA